LGFGRIKNKNIQIYQSNERTKEQQQFKDPVVLDDYSFISQSVNPNEIMAEG